MRTSRFALSLACLAMLSACGGGGGTGSPTPAPTPVPTPTPAPTPTPTPVANACSLEARAGFFLDTLDEWYLFPDLLDRTPDPAAFTNANAYIDALVAPARAQNKDRFFTYVTSIAEENAFFFGGESGGFGFRLAYDTFENRVFVAETFEDTAALGAGIDRGSELLAIGTTNTNLRTVGSLMASGGPGAVFEALGPETPGTTRVFRIRDQSGVEREATLTKTNFTLDPVSDRYGVRIIDDGYGKVGYLNLRTFIDPAADDLRDAFERFRQEGATQLIVDLRYNGGGALVISDLLGDLMGRDLAGQVYYELALRPSKASGNEVYVFTPPPEAIAPTKIAFIGTQATASASELVINGMQPYLGTDMALIGSNTFGKPVGQSAYDRPQCDDRLRPLTFQIQNADGNGDYFNGLATTVPNTCRAFDDMRLPLGDPRENMIRTALDFLAGRPCSPIADATRTASASPVAGGRTGLLSAERPRSVAEREVPGLN